MELTDSMPPNIVTSPAELGRIKNILNRHSLAFPDTIPVRYRISRKTGKGLIDLSNAQSLRVLCLERCSYLQHLAEGLDLVPVSSLNSVESQHRVVSRYHHSPPELLDPLTKDLQHEIDDTQEMASRVTACLHSAGLLQSLES